MKKIFILLLLAVFVGSYVAAEEPNILVIVDEAAKDVKSPFINGLKDKGFNLIEASQADYSDKISKGDIDGVILLIFSPRQGNINVLEYTEYKTIPRKILLILALGEPRIPDNFNAFEKNLNIDGNSVFYANKDKISEFDFNLIKEKLDKIVEDKTPVSIIPLKLMSLKRSLIALKAKLGSLGMKLEGLKNKL
jgi:hypothetical protein